MTSLSLWRVGNVQSTTRFLLVFFAIFFPFFILGSLAMQLAGSSLDLAGITFDPKFLVPVAGQILMMLLMFPLVFAWQRRSMYAMELLRPMVRRDWVQLIFRGTGCELIPLAITATVFLILGYHFGPLDEWSLLQLGMLAAGTIGFVALLVAFGLWMLTMTSIWWGLLSVVVVTAVFAGGVAAAATLADLNAVTPSTEAILLLIVLFHVLAYAAFRLVGWRWQNFEIGRIV